jgi:hypothetical protein
MRRVRLEVESRCDQFSSPRLRTNARQGSDRRRMRDTDAIASRQFPNR